MIEIFLFLAFAIYVITILFAYTGYRKLIKVGHSVNNSSFKAIPFSVVIAAHNEEKNLPRLLQSLINQEIEWTGSEVIFVLDRCSDKSREMIEQFNREQIPLRILEIKEVKGNISPKKNALIHGFQAAQNDILIQTDADAVLHPEWLRRHLEMYQAHPEIAGCLGLFRFQTPRNFFGFWVSAEKSLNFLLSAGVAAFNRVFSVFGINVSYNRQQIDPVRLLKKYIFSLSGDDDLIFQEIVKKKKRIAFLGNSEVAPQTIVPGTFSAFWKQRKRHMSAGQYYSGFPVRFYGLFLLSWTLVWMLMFFSPYGVFLLISKWILDFYLILPLIRKYAGITSFRQSFLAVFILELFYIPYMWITGVASRFSNITWN